MNVFRVYVDEVIEYQYDNSWQEFYLNKDEAEKRKEELDTYSHSKGDLHSRHVYVDEISLEEAKEDMTVEQFEDLFNVSVDSLLK